MIIVNSSGSTATVSFYEKSSNSWKQNNSLTCSGFVGSQGVTSNPAEGKSATPKGLYRVGEVFYQNNMPKTGLRASFRITNNTHWIDDPKSSMYNTRFVGNLTTSTHSEHMWEIPQYKYGFVINYNRNPVIKGKGSAIFFHVSANRPTGGCVAVSEDKVIAYLGILNSQKNPYILII